METQRVCDFKAQFYIVNVQHLIMLEINTFSESFDWKRLIHKADFVHILIQQSPSFPSVNKV